MSCNICCESYNKTTRKVVRCPYCNSNTCRTCAETYILSETTPKCMQPSCGKEWSRKVLRSNFTNAFLNGKYKKHLEKVLFDKEKSLLPATQLIFKETIRKRNLKKKILEMKKMITKLKNEKYELERQLNHPETTSSSSASANATAPSKRVFVRQCPAENCRGFVSSQWKCGICENWTCPDCHELKGLDRDCEHICDPNNVETAKLLEKDSKPCPSCQSLIFKISGCDQMWCTQCHTGFSWKTGKLENVIHNPHYYEWQRTNGGLARNAGDVECGRELTNNTCSAFDTAITKHTTLHKTKTLSWGGIDRKMDANVEKIYDMIRVVLHTKHVELPKFQKNYVEINETLRIAYLENTISEEKFNTTIQRNDKRNKKHLEIAQVLELSNTVFTDIIHRLIDSLNKSEPNTVNIKVFQTEINELINYCNDILKDISFTYNSVQCIFDECMKFTTSTFDD